MLPEDPPPPTPDRPASVDPPVPVPESSATSDAPASAPVRPIATTRRRLPFVQISVVLVAILAGSGLFLSGYTMGRHAASDPGTPASEETAFQPFWDTFHTIQDRYAGGTVDQSTLIQGAIRGMIGSLDDPFSAYLTSDQYRQSLQGISGQFEGIGAQVASQATQRHPGLHAARTDLPPHRHRADRRLARTRRRDSPVGDIVASIDGASVDGLTVDAVIGKIRGPKGSVGRSRDRARRREADLGLRSPATSSSPRRSTARCWPAALVGYIRLAGFSDAAADQVVEALARRPGRRPHQAHPRPARQSGRLRDRRSQGRQPVHRVRDRLLGAGRTGEPDTDHTR